MTEERQQEDARKRRRPSARPAARRPAGQTKDAPTEKADATSNGSAPKPADRPSGKRPAARRPAARNGKKAAKAREGHVAPEAKAATKGPAAPPAKATPKAKAANKATGAQPKAAPRAKAAPKATSTREEAVLSPSMGEETREGPASQPEKRSSPSVPSPGVQVSPEELESVATEPALPLHDARSDENDTQEIEPTEPDREAQVDRQLQDIERRLDRLLSAAHELRGDPVARRRAAEALAQIASRLVPPDQRPNPDESLLGTARDLLSTDYYFRQWGRVAMRSRSEEVDDFGLDPTYERRVIPLFELLYRKWFRVEAKGLEHVPAEGRAMLVSNHGGAVPWDGVMLKTAVHLEHPRTDLRWLAEDFIFHMPFLGAFMNRIGAVRACPENAERLLGQERLVAVFPEGIKGIGKLYKQRYRLQRFGRGGYVKLALRTGTPIVPVAIVGAEEASPLLFKITRLTRGLGLPFVPVTPTFPLLGPFGLLPLPTRWRLLVGEPIPLDGYGPEDAENAVLVNRLNERVRSTIQGMINQLLATRSSVFFG